MSQRGRVVGVVLAGGRALRLGGVDKGLLVYAGQPLVSYACQALLAVTDTVVINANRNLALYAQLGFEVLPDADTSFCGPLAGVLAAMRQCKAELLLVLPCDLPLVTSQHVQRLLSTYIATGAEAVVAFDGQHLQPAVMAISTRVQGRLQAYLAAGERKLTHFLKQLTMVTVDFSATPAMFTNINTPEDLAWLVGHNAQ